MYVVHVYPPVLWTTIVCSIVMGNVFNEASNFSQQKGIFMWFIILLIVSTASPPPFVCADFSL